MTSETDLKAAIASDSNVGPGFTTAIANLKQLIALPDANETTAQQAQARSDVKALNQFFGTPGLYS